MFVTHPLDLMGRGLWLDLEAVDILRRLHYGDPTLGWEGDQNLALYRTEDGRWELWRLEDDCQYHRICRSRPGQKLDRGLIIALVTHDTRRGFDPASILAHNDKVFAAKEQQEADRAAEALEKVYWGAARDIGHHYG